nr:MAG TPA: hypothetical protein [Crassvirales sp.]
MQQKLLVDTMVEICQRVSIELRKMLQRKL